MKQINSLRKKRKRKKSLIVRLYLNGNKFACKTPDEKKSKSLFIPMSPLDRKSCNDAAQLAGVRITAWARKVLLESALKEINSSSDKILVHIFNGTT